LLYHFDQHIGEVVQDDGLELGDERVGAKNAFAYFVGGNAAGWKEETVFDVTIGL
jgi:hypothetical protein